MKQLSDPASDLSLPSNYWIELGPMNEPVPGTYEFTDPDPTQPRRYYRFRSP